MSKTLIGQVINADDDTVWPRTTTGLGLIPGVLDKGNVFKGAAIISGDINQNIGVGSWLSGLFGKDDGTIKCNQSTDKGNLFDMFVYIYKNYRAGMTAASLENASVTEADRLMVVCNKNDLTKPGLLQPSNMWGTPNNMACNNASVEWYTGVTIDEQMAYIKTLYEEMRANSNNKYIVAWEDLGYYNGVDGYYLYSNDFSAQCGSSSFQNTQGNETGYIYKLGYKINEDGTVEQGYYPIKESTDTARKTFVGTEPLTCQDLVDKMNGHIKTYIQFVNYEVYKICSVDIDEIVEIKRDEIQEKYIDNQESTESELADANAVLGEYQRIQDENEYVATMNGESESLIKVSNESESGMPTDYIWTCRSHLPFINVEVQPEDDLTTIIESEFTSYCYKTMDLAWVICPIINAVSNAVDGLSEMIEGFF